MSYISLRKYFKFIISFEISSKFEKREAYIYKHLINKGV